MRRARRPAVAVLGVLGVLSLGLATVGHAAQLPVRAATVTVLTAAHPCPGTLTATTTPTTGTSSTVAVTAPPGCTGRTVRVAVSSGTTVRHGTVTASSSGPATVTLDGAYTPSAAVQVSATVSGWHLPASWSYTAPVSTPACAVYRLEGQVEVLQAGTCAVSSVKFVNVWGVQGFQLANVGISFTSANVSHPDFFKFTVDLSRATNAPANWNWSTSGTRGSNLRLSPTYRCSSLPLLAGHTNPSSGPTSGFEFQLTEQRAGDSLVTCAP